MARGTGKVQKTIKSLISKQLAAELKTAAELTKGHDTHLGRGVCLGGIGTYCPYHWGYRAIFGVFLAQTGRKWMIRSQNSCYDSTAPISKSIE